MAAVPVMHEKVNQWAKQENEVRQHAQQMSAMLCPKKEGRDDREGDEAAPIPRMTR